LEWTKNRWIITFSKKKGDITIKQKEKNKKLDVLEKIKNTETYKIMMKKFPDAELIDTILNKKKDEN